MTVKNTLSGNLMVMDDFITRVVSVSILKDGKVRVSCSDLLPEGTMSSKGFQIALDRLTKKGWAMVAVIDQYRNAYSDKGLDIYFRRSCLSR